MGGGSVMVPLRPVYGGLLLYALVTVTLKLGVSLKVAKTPPLVKLSPPKITGVSYNVQRNRLSCAPTVMTVTFALPRLET